MALTEEEKAKIIEEEELRADIRKKHKSDIDQVVNSGANGVAAFLIIIAGIIIYHTFVNLFMK